MIIILTESNEMADLYQCAISTSVLFVIMMLTIALYDSIT